MGSQWHELFSFSSSHNFHSSCFATSLCGFRENWIQLFFLLSHCSIRACVMAYSIFNPCHLWISLCGEERKIMEIWAQQYRKKNMSLSWSMFWWEECWRGSSWEAMTTSYVVSRWYGCSIGDALCHQATLEHSGIPQEIHNGSVAINVFSSICVY